MVISKKILPFLLLSLVSCDIFNKIEPDHPSGVRSPEFSNQPDVYQLPDHFIHEASGLVPCRYINGYLWTHQDSGNSAHLYLISYNATELHPVELSGAENVDWEDIASGPGPEAGVQYLYIGDIGNNFGRSSRSLVIYRIPELKEAGQFFSAENLEKITFNYPDGPKDAETLIVDPKTKDIFIVSKELTRSAIYRLPYPQSTHETMTAEYMGNIPNVIAATAGDIAFDGAEILVRNYGAVFYWARKDGESVGQTLQRIPDKTLPYHIEQQGEAVCFDNQANGYYTLGEKASENPVHLYYYPRKK